MAPCNLGAPAPSSSQVRTLPFQGGNTGSNPVGATPRNCVAASTGMPWQGGNTGSNPVGATPERPMRASLRPPLRIKSSP
jgi:hypothetical protein